MNYVLKLLITLHIQLLIVMILNYVFYNNYYILYFFSEIITCVYNVYIKYYGTM